jgi:serine/threonine-protein kinase RIO1
MSKWRLNNHIIGKIYDLTQENMSAMISDLEMLHTDSLQNYRELLDSHKRYIKTLQEENARLREALEFYAQGDKTKTFSGEERYLQLVANEMDISKVDGQWKTGKCAREALKGGE